MTHPVSEGFRATSLLCRRRLSTLGCWQRTAWNSKGSEHKRGEKPSGWPTSQSSESRSHPLPVSWQAAVCPCGVHPSYTHPWSSCIPGTPRLFLATAPARAQPQPSGSPWRESLFLLLWSVGLFLAGRAGSVRCCPADAEWAGGAGGLRGQERGWPGPRRCYRTFCSSCRSQEGSGCPSLCSSLDSSTLCSR